MILIQFDPEREGPLMVSIPRDLLVQIPCPSWGRERVNAAFNGCPATGESGPDLVVRTVAEVTGLRIHHYVQIDFAGFAQVVDAVGGVEICFPNPARDNNSGLSVAEPGCQVLGGVQGLAYVRSRHYEELIDGDWRETSPGDLNRIARQQQVLYQIAGNLKSLGAITKLPALSGSIGSALAVDDTLGLGEALALAWNVRSFPSTAVSVTVPAVGETFNGRAVLVPTADADALWEALADHGELPAAATPTTT